MSSLIDTTRKRVLAGLIALAVLVSAGVALASRGGDADAVAPSTTTTTTTTVPPTTVAPTTTTRPPPPTYPLTGVRATDPAILGRAALVVKIDNGQPRARPQIGINQADVVFEERVEGSVTRLLAIFHSQGSIPVGPVRSARTSDIPIVAMLRRPLFAWSGANSTFAQRIRAAPLVDVGYDVQSGHYFRERSRRAPHNLMLRSTGEMYTIPHPGSGPPPPLFRYRQPGRKPAGLQPLTHVRITYGTAPGSAPVEYRWNGFGWARWQAGTPHVDAAGVQVAPQNVVIQFVNYVPSDTGDQFGVPIPEASLVGKGYAWVLMAGGVVRGTWSKPVAGAVTQYFDLKNRPISLTPGTTWVALPSPGDAVKLG